MPLVHLEEIFAPTFEHIWRTVGLPFRKCANSGWSDLAARTGRVKAKSTVEMFNDMQRGVEQQRRQDEIVRATRRRIDRRGQRVDVASDVVVFRQRDVARERLTTCNLRRHPLVETRRHRRGVSRWKSAKSETSAAAVPDSSARCSATRRRERETV